MATFKEPCQRDMSSLRLRQLKDIKLNVTALHKRKLLITQLKLQIFHKVMTNSILYRLPANTTSPFHSDDC